MAEIQALSKLFRLSPTSIIFPNTPEYFAELAIYWSAANKELQPKAIVKPKTTAEASKVIKLLVEHKAEFAIRSGGGTPIPSANNTNGVLVSLRELNASISFPEKGVVRLGPGLRWGEVYAALEERGETAAGGRIGQVGVGGFLLGGGFSHLSHEYGLACDSIISYEVVLGNGEIVTATKSENPDLFWALKGGTNNFGLVASFDMKTIEQKDGIWGGLMIVPGDHVQAAVKALHEWQLYDQEKDEKAATQVIVVKGPGLGAKDAPFAIVVIYYGAAVENPECLHRLTKLPTVHSTLKFQTHKSLNDELGGPFDCTKRHLFFTGSYKVNNDLNEAAREIFEGELAKTELYEKDAGSYNTFTYQPVSKSMLAKGEGQHAFDVSSKDAPYMWWITATQYSTAEFEDLIKKAAATSSAQIEEKAKGQGIHHDYLYLNDCASNQDPLSTYGEASVKRMKEVQTKYDPDGIFSTLCTGGFKLPKS